MRLLAAMQGPPTRVNFRTKPTRVNFRTKPNQATSASRSRPRPRPRPVALGRTSPAPSPPWPPRSGRTAPPGRPRPAWQTREKTSGSLVWGGVGLFWPWFWGGATGWVVLNLVLGRGGLGLVGVGSSPIRIQPASGPMAPGELRRKDPSSSRPQQKGRRARRCSGTKSPPSAPAAVTGRVP